MQIRRILTAATTTMILLATLLAASMAGAQHHHGDATPGADHEDHDQHGDAMGMTGTGVVYMTIANTGDEDDELLSAETDRAQAVEVHEMQVKDDIGVMLPHEGPLAIPAGESVALEPGGLHIMLINLNDDIRFGDTFDLVLTFERAGEVTVPVTAVLDVEDAEGDPVEVGDLEITGVWSRPAPRIDGITGTPAATPDATPSA